LDPFKGLTTKTLLSVVTVKVSFFKTKGKLKNISSSLGPE
jgi:hypothetical protein